MDVIHSQINPASAEFRYNLAHNTEQVRSLHKRIRAAQDGGGGSGPLPCTDGAINSWRVSASMRSSMPGRRFLSSRLGRL